MQILCVDRRHFWHSVLFCRKRMGKWTFLQDVSKRFHMILLGEAKELEVGLHFAVIICINSSELTCPSLSISVSLIISSTSSSVCVSPVCHDMTEFCYPETTIPILAKTQNTSRISSSLSISFIFLAPIVKNSENSMVPLPSPSTSLIISCN